MNGHYPKPGGLAAALAVLIAVVLAACSPKGAAGGDAACGLSDDDFRTEGILQAIPVRATFLDEVSWDIPHQNWGVREWDADFRAMKNMGINTVVLIRAGLGRWIAAPFECLLESEEVYYPRSIWWRCSLRWPTNTVWRSISACTIRANTGRRASSSAR